MTVSASAGEDEAEIFEAHAEFAADPELARLTEDAVRAGTSAERAVVGAFETFRELLVASESEYLAARASDLDDVRDRVVKILLGMSTSGDRPDRRSMIVAHELTPSQTASIPVDLIAGIVTETGSPTSHAAILARALGVPAVVACEGLLAVTRAGVDVAIDGRAGEAIVDPSPAEREAVVQPPRAGGAAPRRARRAPRRARPDRRRTSRRARREHRLDRPHPRRDRGGWGGQRPRADRVPVPRARDARPPSRNRPRSTRRSSEDSQASEWSSGRSTQEPTSPCPSWTASSRRTLRSASGGSG